MIGAIAGGCGSDDALSMEDYFEQMQEIRDRYDSRLNELRGSLPDDPFADEETRIALQEFLTESVVLFDGALAEAADLRPPAEAREEHRRLLDTGEELSRAYRDIESGVLEAESINEVAEVFALLFGPDSEYVASERRFQDACLDLEDVAWSSGMAVDLHCAG